MYARGREPGNEVRMIYTKASAKILEPNSTIIIIVSLSGHPHLIQSSIVVFVA